MYPVPSSDFLLPYPKNTRFDLWYWVIELTFESWYHCTTVNYRDSSVRWYHDKTVLPCGVSPCSCSWDKTVCGQPVSSVARALVVRSAVPIYADRSALDGSSTVIGMLLYHFSTQHSLSSTPEARKVGYWCRIHLWFRLMGGLQAKSMTSQRNRATYKMADMCYCGNVMTTTRWRLYVTMATLWQQQDGGYALLWKRYDNNDVSKFRWRFLHLQQYSHRLNLLLFIIVHFIIILPACLGFKFF